MKTDGMSRILLVDEVGYRLTKLVEVRCIGDSKWETICEPGEYMLLIVKNGTGLLRLGTTNYKLKGNGVGPRRGGKAELSADGAGMMLGYFLSFVESGRRNAHVRRPSPELQEQGEWSPALYNRLLPLMERLCEEAESDKVAANIRRARLFCTLLEELVGTSAERTEQADHDPVRRTREYMERHCDEELSREQLAKIAELSPWHYSVLFKQATGVSPMAYLAELRIRKAKETLLRTNRTLRQVARESGYRDEFYFSRKFRLSVGVSPTVYVKNAPERLASLCFAYDGNMMALQLTPFITMVDENATHRREYFRRIPYLLDYDEQVERRMNLLRQANPYLIICGDDQNLDSLGKIAPTFTVPWTGMGWREHLLHIGGAVRKEKEAERWLEAYNNRVQDARLRVGRALGNASCIALALYDDILIAYRSRNMGELLYRDLQIAEPFDEDCPVFIKRKIELEELHELDADLLLLHVYSDPQAEQWVERLKRDERWQSLKAVREQHIFRIDSSIWREYSAYSHSFMLTELERMFAKV